MDLVLEVSGRPVRSGLEGALRDAVREGRLGAGTRLPSSRALSVDLGVARNTVAEAYAQLVAEGWLDSRIGSGTWVVEHHGDTPVAASSAQPREVSAPFDLTPGVPDLSFFPRSAWLQATRRVLGTTPDDAFGYADPRGLGELRAALAGYLGRVRHVVVKPENVVVCAGISHGLSLLCQVIDRRGGRSIAVEGYSYEQLWKIAAADGLRLIPMPIDAKGAQVELCAESDGVVLTPGHQFPWGVTLHPSRRRQLLDRARSSIVIEDDYDGEFRYDRQPVGALQALAPDRIVYVGTASKSLVPGLRLGWLVVPDDLLDEVLAVKATGGATCSSLEQLVLADLIVSGAFDRLVRRARLHYRRRRDRLITELAPVPGAVIQGAAAGLQTVVLLPPGSSEIEVVARGLEAGVALEGLGAYTLPGRSGPPALVVGFARPPEHRFEGALQALIRTLS